MKIFRLDRSTGFDLSVYIFICPDTIVTSTYTENHLRRSSTLKDNEREKRPD